jgi:hypothetical protein
MPKKYVLNAEPGSYKLTGSPLAFSLTTQLAQDWLNDARAEATHRRSPDNWHYRRREVLFAVCFLEAYLFEWALSLFQREGNRVLKYFPAGDKRGVADKWGVIPAQLHRDGFLANQLRIRSGSHNANWKRLLAIRNGLTHGTSSWPEVRGGKVAHPAPTPKLGDVGALRPGWAVNVATYRVKALHAAAGTTPPAWITARPSFRECPTCEAQVVNGRPTMRCSGRARARMEARR